MTDTIITSATQNVAIQNLTENQIAPLAVMVNGYSTIFNQNIPRIEINGKPVLLTVQVAEFYGTETENVKKNFQNNKTRFVVGEHYFELTGEPLKQLKNEAKNFPLVGKRVNKVYLWTKKGVFQHAKMLGTDRAWDIYDLLMENYFNKPVLHYAQPDEMFMLQANVNKYFRERIDKLETEQDSLKRSVQLNLNTCQEAVTIVANYVQNLNTTVQELSARLDNTPDEYLPINKAAANSLNKSVKRLAYMYNEQVGTSLPSAVYNIQEGIRVLLTGRYKIDIDEELDKLQAWLRFDYNRRVKSKTKTQDTLTPSEINKLSIYAPISTRHAWTHAVQAHVDFKIQHFQDLIRLKQE